MMKNTEFKMGVNKTVNNVLPFFFLIKYIIIVFV